MGIEQKYVHEAYTALFQQDYRRAIELFQKAIDINPTSHSLYYKLSITYARNHNITAAISAIKEAIRLAKGTNLTYELQLQHLTIRELVQHAYQALEVPKKDLVQYVQPLVQWMEVDPLQLEVKWVLALIYLRLGEESKANEQIQAILEIEPEHPKAKTYFISRSENNYNVH